MWKGDPLYYKDSRRGLVPVVHQPQYRVRPDGDWVNFTGNSVPSGANRVAVISGLHPYTIYDIRTQLSKEYDGNQQVVVAISTSFVKWGAPSPPTNVQSTSGCDGNDRADIDVTWQASETAGFEDGIVVYTVELGTYGNTSWSSMGAYDFTYLITIPEQNLYYTLRLNATNGANLITSHEETIISGIPSKPKNVEVTSAYDITATFPNTAKVTVTWERPTSIGCGITNYHITYGPTGGGGVQTLTTLSTSYTITGVVPYTEYSVTVKIVTGGDLEASADPVVITTAQGKSDPVTQPQSTAQTSSISLSWSAPVNPYGVIDKYNITYQRTQLLVSGPTAVNCPTGTGQTQTKELLPPSTSVDLTGLDSNSEYTIEITPYTDGGNIAGLTTLMTVNTLSVELPLPTVAPVTSTYDSSLSPPNQATASITWQVVNGDKCMILQFRVEYKINGTSSTVDETSLISGNERSFILSSLILYTYYQVRVVSKGQSTEVESDWKTFRTVEGPSGPVSSTAVNAAVSTVTVSWSAPSQPYGVISAYHVSYQRQRYLAGCDNSPVDAGNVTTDALSLTHQFNNLSPYSEYHITVIPVNGAGEGQPISQTISTQATVPDPSTKPQTPSISAITPRSATAQIFMITCTQRNGLFEQYIYGLTDVTYGLSTKQESTTDTSLALNNLIPFTQYTVVYQWKSSEGSTQFSDAASFSTKSTQPPAPAITFDAGHSYISVTVTPPYPPYDYLTAVIVTCTNDQSADFHQEADIVQNSNDNVTLRFSGSNVNPGKTYQCWAKVESAEFESLSSLVVNVTTEEISSGPVSLTAVTPAVSTVSVSWSAPTQPHGVISAYIVSYQRQRYLAGCDNSPVDAGNVTTDALSLTYQFNNLSPYSEYQITVIPVNGVGEGEPIYQTVSTQATAPDPSAEPPKPNISAILPHSATVQLYTIPCTQRIGPFQQYLYRLTDVTYGLSTKHESTTDTSLTLSNLIPFTQYTIVYQWTSSEGSTQFSDAASFSTNSTQPPAPNITADAGTSDISATVTPPYPPYDYLTAVIVTCTNAENDSLGQEVDIVENSNESVTVRFSGGNVNPGKTYQCWAKVKSAEFESLSSVKVTTYEGRAGPPRQFEARDVTTSNARLAWTTPLSRDGLITRYEYSCQAVETKNPSRKTSLADVQKQEFQLVYQYSFSDADRDYITPPIDGLWSATKYECSVRAVNGAGEGDNARIIFWTEPEDIRIPGGTKLDFDVKQFSDVTVYLLLPTISSSVVEIEVYRIVVQEISESTISRRKRSVVDNVTHTFDEAQNSGSNSYIAAEWNQNREFFVVGDGRNYSDYYNAPLVEEQRYYIWYGVGSVVDGISRFVFLSVAVTAGIPATNTQAGLLSILLFNVFLVIVLVIFDKYCINPTPMEWN